MKPQNAADPGAMDLEDRKDRDSPCGSDSERPSHAGVQNDNSSVIVFRIDEKSVRRCYLFLLIPVLCMCFVEPAIGYYVFDLADPVAFFCILVLVLCTGTALSFSLNLWGLRKQRLVVSKEGIDLRFALFHKFVSWENTSHYVLHHHLILSRLDLFDHRGKRRMIISGFFDCAAIAEAIEMMGIPQRRRKHP